MNPTAPRSSRGFSLLEVTVVALIVAILAAVVVPRFVGLEGDARTSSASATLGAVRAALAAHRTNGVIAGTDPFPSLEQLTEPGRVLAQPIPPNPFTGASGVQAVSRAQAEAHAVLNEAVYGWNYFVDNDADPPVAIFYANSDDESTAEAADGRRLLASEL